ncbi:MAG: S-layer homology domain-containing protein [Oscillospiraceae bacterium]|nr:S-layer homology domain-containing protein [Oscillospiraceae bacterium]
MTVLGGSMTVSYTLDGVVVGGGSTVPYACTIDASALSVGAHTLQVAFSDGAGYQETKIYCLAKLADGTVTTDESVEFPSDWAMDEVSAAISLGLVRQSFQRGYTENITRGDFCALVIDLIEAKTGQEIDDFLSEKGVSRESGAFTDSSSAEVLAASALGIVNGRGNGIFDPDAGITRQEAAKMLTAAANVLGMDTPNGSAISFADADSFTAWGAESIAFISAVNDKTSGLSVMGDVGDSRFDPNGGYTRQQAYITMLHLYRAL